MSDRADRMRARLGDRLTKTPGTELRAAGRVAPAAEERPSQPKKDHR
ncbi:MAG: hypothetical protein HZB39_15680 [Planctomycetes bacterium]|nr:hypothetical protein [Planctomycetota bacterium]